MSNIPDIRKLRALEQGLGFSMLLKGPKALDTLNSKEPELQQQSVEDEVINVHELKGRGAANIFRRG